MRMVAVFALTLLVATRLSLAESPDSMGESYRAHLAAAALSARLGEPAQARQWLEGAPQAWRGWEWRYLDELLDQSQIVTEETSSSVFSLALHPRGTLLAAALTDGKIALIDPATKRQVAELSGHAGGTFDVAFDPTGERLVSTGADRIARVWSVAERSVILEFSEHKFPVTSVVFAPDGESVYTSAYFVSKETPIEGRVHQWNLETGKIARTFRGGKKPLSSLALSPDGTLLAAGSWDSCAFLWRTGVDEPPQQLGGPPGPGKVLRVNDVAFSPDGQLLAAASDHEWAKVYRVADGAELVTLQSADANCNAVCFAPDGATLATGFDNGEIKLWRAADWSEKATLRGHTLGIKSLVWHAKANTLFSGSPDRSIRAWDPEFTEYGGLRARFGDNNYSVHFTSDGESLVCSSSDHTIGLVDARSGKERSRWTAHPDLEVCTAAASPDGSRIASCSWDKTVRVFDATTHEELANIALPAGAAYFAWHPDGKRLAAALRDHSAVLVDLESKRVITTFAGHTATVNSVAFDRAGEKLLTASADKTARVFNVATGECLATMTGHEGPIESAVFLPKGGTVVTGSHDGSVRLWDEATGEAIRVLHRADDAIYRVAASPDGARVAAGGSHLYLLDPGSSGALVRERPLSDTIWHLDWSPDGERLAITSWNGEIVIFRGKR